MSIIGEAFVLIRPETTGFAGALEGEMETQRGGFGKVGLLAGAAVVAALAVPKGMYNVVDDVPLTKRSYADALSAAAGKAAWLRIPGRAALLLGSRSTSLTRLLRVSNARFRNASEWTPMYPSALEGWIATAEALR